jgi:hypothetical protein
MTNEQPFQEGFVAFLAVANALALGQHVTFHITQSEAEYVKGMFLSLPGWTLATFHPDVPTHHRPAWMVETYKGLHHVTGSEDGHGDFDVCVSYF